MTKIFTFFTLLFAAGLLSAQSAQQHSASSNTAATAAGKIAAGSSVNVPSAATGNKPAVNSNPGKPVKLVQAAPLPKNLAGTPGRQIPQHTGSPLKPAN
jgi:hypothetical protein